MTDYVVRRWRWSLLAPLPVLGLFFFGEPASIREAVLTEGEPAVFFLRLKNGDTPYELQVELPSANRADLAAAVEGLGRVPLRSS